MDQSLPGTESVFCFQPVLNPAPQCNFPLASENSIVEPFHGQEFSANSHSQTWNGEVFFPFPSQEFSINLLFKAKSREITFLHMEKGTLTRMEELSTQEREEKSFG
jgi:hypothetical protein